MPTCQSAAAIPASRAPVMLCIGSDAAKVEKGSTEGNIEEAAAAAAAAVVEVEVVVVDDEEDDSTAWNEDGASAAPRRSRKSLAATW